MKSQSELQRACAQTELEEPMRRGYPKVWVIGLYGKRIEDGRFLVGSEREKLAVRLKKLVIVPMNGS